MLAMYMFDVKERAGKVTWSHEPAIEYTSGLSPLFKWGSKTVGLWTWGLLVERPSNLTGLESDFEIKVSRKVGCVLTSNKVHFISLADTFTVQFSNHLKLPSGVENKTA